MAAFALSPAASYLTGTMIAVDGGVLALLVSVASPAPRCLVACAHGTRNPTGRRLIAELALAARALRPGLTTTAAFVDVQPPTVVDVVAELSAAGGPRSSCRCCCRAGTTCTSTSRARWRAPDAVAARPLGPDPRLVEVLRDRLVEAGADPRDPLTAVVLAAAGSSDPRGRRRREHGRPAAAHLGRAGDDGLRVGRDASRARRGGRRSAGRGRAGRRRRLPAGAGPLPRQARRGRAPTWSPLPCCRTSGSPPCCWTATTRLVGSCSFGLGLSGHAETGPGSSA